MRERKNFERKSEDFFLYVTPFEQTIPLISFVFSYHFSCLWLLLILLGHNLGLAHSNQGSVEYGDQSGKLPTKEKSTKQN